MRGIFRWAGRQKELIAIFPGTQALHIGEHMRSSPSDITKHEMEVIDHDSSVASTWTSCESYLQDLLNNMKGESKRR